MREGFPIKKICVFCETWSSGGIESLLCKLLTQMDCTGLRIDLVVARREDSVFTQALTASGVRILPLSGSKLRWLSNCRRFRALLRENQYDVVHVNAFQGLQLCYLSLARRAGVPVRIAHSHGSGLRRGALRWAKLLLHNAGKRLFARDATHRWACSRQAADFLFGPEAAFQFIPNGIDTARFRFRAEERDRVRARLEVEGRFVVGSVGRLDAMKNHTFLLEVLARLLPRRPESLLLVVGDGPERQRLEDRAAALGLSGHVRFYGVTGRVEELLWAMDAFAFPSLFEALGMAAVEAQAAGLPVVCSEHIPPEANLTALFHTVPLCGGADAWAEALLCRNPASREEFAAAVARAGFESRDVAAMVRDAYLHNPSIGGIMP